MPQFTRATHTPVELVSFAITIAEMRDTGDVVQTITWSADVRYDDGTTRHLRGNLEQYLTPTQRTQLLTLLQLLADRAGTEMLEKVA